MIKHAWSLLLLVVLLALFSCESGDCVSSANDWRHWMESSGRVKVLSTTAMIGDFVKKVGGEFVDAQVLIQGQLDPHSYQLVKGDDEKLSVADVIFYNGLGLEHGPSLHYHLKENSRAIALGDLIEKSDPTLILFAGGQRDPHIWMDISLWSRILPHIAEGLSQHDPSHAEYYRKRASELQQEYRKEHFYLQKQIWKIPANRRYLITSHDAFSYFARAYLKSEEESSEEQWGHRFAAPEGLAPESQLSHTDIQEILDHAAQFDVHVLFPESNVNPASLQKILSASDELGLDLRISKRALYGDAMGCPGSGAGTYRGMMRWNIETLIQNWEEDSHE